MIPHLVQRLAVGGTCLAVLACDAATDPDPGPAIPSSEPALAIASNSWITRASMPGDYRWGLTSAVVPNAAGQSILYTIGGAIVGAQPSGPTTGNRATVQAYNAATNTWSTKAPMPLALYRTNGAGVINGKIYVSGGRERGDKDYAKTLFVYDPAKNTWSRKRDMPADENWGGLTGVIDKKLYVLTCEDQEDCNSRFGNLMSLYRYDPATDQWTFLSFTPRPVSEPMGGVIGGKLYAVGGPAGELVVYDPVRNTWTQKASLPVPRVLGAAAVLDRKLYIMGGFERRPDGTRVPVRRTTMYDPATNTWTNKAQMPTQRVDFTASKVFVNGQSRISAVGGVRPGNHVQYIR